MSFRKLSPRTLRRHKGVSFPGIATVFFCYDQTGRLLMAKRSQQARDEQGCWEAGGGGLKFGQSLEENLRRELMEEYGIEPLALDFIAFHESLRELANGVQTHWLAFCFAVLIEPAQLKINEPDMIDEVNWFSLDRLPAPLHSQIEIFLDQHGSILRQIIARRTSI